MSGPAPAVRPHAEHALRRAPEHAFLLVLAHVRRMHELLRLEVADREGRAEAHALNLNLPIDARRVDAIILSHAHIDHW